MKEVGDWWRMSATDALKNQEEALAWWVQFTRCLADVKCAPRKVLTLSERMTSTMMAAVDSAYRLTAEQADVVAKQFGRGPALAPGCSAAEAQLAASHYLSETADKARAWGMIPLTAQARTAAAWAEFWSLPSTEQGT
jgi:hypothetical protein